MKVLVTGAAGFIGMHVSAELLRAGHEVLGVDSLNDYYDPSLKVARLRRLEGTPGFEFRRLDISDRPATAELFRTFAPDRVVHLAAQAGVRYSIENPDAYIDANLVGFANVLEGCRHSRVGHLVFASSSSVYGANAKLPFSVADRVDEPVSLYAATKKANELMAYTYASLYGIPVTGLRFFTVYGPWGRPDMAYYKFAEAMLAGREIPVFNHGKLRRDFTYIDDIVQGVVRVLDVPPSSLTPPYAIHNIGNSSPVELGEFISTLESVLGVKARKKMLPMQPGDVPATYADVSSLEAAVGFKPSTSLADGLAKFAAWYRDYHRVS